ncbi:MAG: response regulator [Candidatus Thiodiazotropha sp.]
MTSERLDKILVVDDNTANLQLLMTLLTAHGYTVFPASDGELALEFIQSTLPDLILLDIKLPGVDGFEVCRQLQADIRTRTIPIVFLSALEDEHDKVTGFQAGGVDYITKPFQPEEMLARVRIHLRLRELTERLEQKVNTRTKELLFANQQLKEEIEERRQAEEALRESRQRLEALLQLNQMSDSSQAELMRFAFDAAIRLTRSKLGYLAFMNEDETEVTMKLCSFDTLDECEVPQTPLIYPREANKLWSEAVSQRLPIITNDCSAPGLFERDPTDKNATKLVRHIDLPLIVDGKIVLVVGVGNKAENYNQDDVQQLSLLMDGMWRLIERKRSDEELKRYHNKLEETVRLRTEELELSRDAAEAANKAKSAFLANMSHELRTPLNAILGFSNIVRNDALIPEEQRKNLDIINRSGEHLLSLINDVLDVAKIEAGGVQITNAPFDLGCMLRDVIDMMLVRSEEKGLRLLIDQSSQFPRYIIGDEPRLRQVIINLIGNAIKYTEKGGVALRLNVSQCKPKQLQIEVEDSGPGISPEDQPRIFAPFVQLGKQSTNQGTGLGLTITRQYIQMMGGTIGLDSTPGKGSVFRVSLPLNETNETDIIQANQTNHGEVLRLTDGQPQYRILIVEDQEDNQALLSHLLESVGLEVRVAENGKKGIELFQSWHPHLIMMDRRMPVLDGEEATQRIRDLPGGKEVKIVAVTASAFKEQQKKMLDAGMDGFVGKPYTRNEIYACLAQQLGLRYQYEIETKIQKQFRPLTAESISILPPPMRTELMQALENLESDHINYLIQQVASYDKELQQQMAQLAEIFDYPTILQALKNA